MQKFVIYNIGTRVIETKYSEYAFESGLHVFYYNSERVLALSPTVPFSMIERQERW